MEDIQVRAGLYREIKGRPQAASSLAENMNLELAFTLDQLRQLENYKVIAHTATAAGVIHWRMIPDNAWEQDDVPF